jgi:hypothetical protein
VNNNVTRALSLATGLAVASSGFVGVAAAAHPKPSKPAKTAKLATTHLTLKATKEKLTNADHVRANVTGTLRAKKAALADEVVTVDERKPGKSKWTATSFTSTTDANGKVSFAFVQTNANEQYRLVFAGDSTYKKSHSGTISIHRSKVAATEGS